MKGMSEYHKNITPQDLADEERRVRELQRTVDQALFYLSVASLTREQAEKITSQVKAKALNLFPDKEETYDLIYQPRFRRVLSRRFGLH